MKSPSNFLRASAAYRGLITNAEGRFVFSNLKAGSYHLVVNSNGLGRVDVVVATKPRSQGTFCLVASGTAGQSVDCRNIPITLIDPR
jgi:hypothetical protein